MRTRFTWLLPFLLLLPLRLHAASTTQPAATVYNLTTNTDTATSVQTGQTLYANQLPPAWNIDLDFGLQPGHTVQLCISVDNGPLVAEWQPPYRAGSRYTPLHLAYGSHTVALTVNGTPITPLVFTLAAAPPTTQPLQGWNLPFGVSDARANPSTHPPIVQMLKDTKSSIVRLWMEDDALKAQGDKYWAIPRAYAAAGYQVFVEYQGYQYATPRFSMPPDSALTLAAQSIPANSGVTWFCLGNEVNTSAYYRGNIAQLVHAETVMSPIIHAHGINFVAQSSLNNVNWLDQFIAAGGWNPVYVDATDYHSYHGPATDVTADLANYLARQQKSGLPGFVSEWGSRAGPDPTTWAASQSAVVNWLKPTGLVFMPFPAVDGQAQTTDLTFPLSAAYAKTVYYPSWVNSMGQ